MKKTNPSTVKIKHIADHLGLSPSTVSLVLNGKGNQLRIAKTTQEKVLKAAKSMNYQPNMYARRLRGAGKVHSGLIIAIFWNSNFTDASLGIFFKGASSYIKEKGYNVEFVVKLYEEDHLYSLKDLMTSQKYNGIIIFSPSEKDLDFMANEDFNLPVVLSNRSSNKYSGIYIDNFKIGRQCANLFEKKEHKKAGIIGVSLKNSGSKIRSLGFKSECEQLGIDIKSEWIQESPHYDITDGYKCATKIIESKEWPDAIFVSTDVQAIGTMIAFREHNINVPKDMEILAFGDNELLEMMSPSISLVVISRELMAKNVLDLLMTKIENNISDPISKIIEPEYRFRESF